jgi:hypothetical protein
VDIVHINISRNTDGTVTATVKDVKGHTHKASFRIEEWMTEDEVLNRAKWELISLGITLKRKEDG